MNKTVHETMVRALGVLIALSLPAISIASTGGYRIYQKSVPRGSAPPSDRRIDSGWVAMELEENGVCALGGEACVKDADCVTTGDKCVVPFDLTTDVRVSCLADEDVYLARSMVVDSAMETPVVSGNSEVVHCFECSGEDGDGDGFCRDGEDEPTPDCDDTRPTVHPDAPQICDGLNNDCSDSLWPQVPRSEVDGDGDGFAPCQGDCDDESGRVHPDAQERDNGVDDNCDGNVDEGVGDDLVGSTVDPGSSPGVVEAPGSSLVGGNQGSFGARNQQSSSELGVYITDPLPVNDTAAFDHQGEYVVWDDAPDIATDGSTWLVVWNQHQHDPVVDQVMASRSTDGGATWDSPTVVQESVQGKPRVASDGQGVWGVVWRRRTDAKVVFSRSADGGRNWSLVEELDSAATSQSDPTLTVGGQQNWAATWVDAHGDIFVSLSTDPTPTWGSKRQLNTNTTGGRHAPDIALSQNGTLVTAWECNACPGDNDRSIRFARAYVGECSIASRNCRIDDDCPDEESCILSDETSCEGFWDDTYCWLDPAWIDPSVGAEDLRDSAPSLATDGNGFWLAVWWGDDGAGLGSLLVARSLDDGANWESPVAVVVQDGKEFAQQATPQVATDGRGTWVVVWESVVDGNNIVSNELDVYVSRSTDEGLSWTEPTRLNTNGEYDDPLLGNDYFPRIATDESDRWVGIWSSEDSFDGVYGNPPHQRKTDTDVFFSRFALSKMELVMPTESENMFDGPAITQHMDHLLAAKNLCVGMVTDGETRLLVRLPLSSPGDVNFSLRDEIDETYLVGSLSSLGGSEEEVDLPVQISQPPYVAFAIMRAPSDFARDSSDHSRDKRFVTLTATHSQSGQTIGEYTRDILLVRPPVMLLHGLGDTPGRWGPPDKPWNIKLDSRFRVKLGDYSKISHSPFHLTVPVIGGEVLESLEEIRLQENIAATQVDVVGHSLGGLLLRLYAANASGSYLRDNNYLEGDINRIITLDTPHFGSPLANVVTFIDNLGGPLGSRIRDGFMKFWRPGPAVEQLQTTSDEILNLPAANLPVHALVGVGGNDFIAAETLYIPRPFSDFVRMLFRDEIFDGEHDLVVGEDSQIGGLPLQTTTSFPYALFPLATGTHFSTLVEERVGNRAVELLNANVGDTTFFALGFPAGPPPSGPPPPDPVLNGLADGDLVIVDPTQGETVVAGDSITVTVELPTGYDPEEMLVFSSEVGVSLDLPSLSTSLEIPEDYLGALTIGAIARNEADIFALAQDVSVEVMTYASLQSISVQNSPVLIRGLSLPSEILVVGHFDDGVDRYVSGASLGTTYVSQDPQIASVDAEGQVTAHGLGTTAIDVYNSGLTAQAIIVVASLPWKLTMLENDLNWNAVLDVAGYDVVRGSLEDLRTSQGDFSTSTDQCLGDNLDVMAVTDPDVPVTGNGYWYLVRVVYSTSGYVGSYDVESTGTLRDDGIAASFLGCP